MRAWRGAVCSVVAASAMGTALAGCGTSERDQVRAKVNQFVHAVDQKDYATVCNDVFSANLLGHLSAYGLKCETALGIALGKVKSPQLAIGGITIKGSTASVTVLTTANGQTAELTALSLTDTAKGWRVVKLVTPQVPKG